MAYRSTQPPGPHFPATQLSSALPLLFPAQSGQQRLHTHTPVTLSQWAPKHHRATNWSGVCWERLRQGP
eukprot:1043127-Pelagomonas_calceolata.AAC.3